MDQIEHNYIEINGLKLHVAEIGSSSSPVAVFLHGFPEIWYSWRHQMIAVANAGFKAIAPDFRGYGLSNPLPVPEKTTFVSLVSDLLAILDARNISKVFLVAKDFGVRIANIFVLLHPERVIGIATCGAPMTPLVVPSYLSDMSEGFYMNRWKVPGRAEADFGRLDAKSVVRNIYILFSRSELPTADGNQEIMDILEPSTPLPPWFTEEDLSAYATLYEKSGFRTALQIPYRSLDEQFEIENPIIKVPALLIMGEKDYILKFPGMEEYIKSGQVNYFVPNLEIKYVPEGSHFVQEQFADLVNQYILAFLRKNTPSA